MNKITIGRMRKKSNPKTQAADANRSRAANAVFVIGAAAVCGMLALPMMPRQTESVPETAVMVMSTGVNAQTSQEQTKEELFAPSNREVAEEWSFYDYIGELFAGLITGQ